MPSPWVHATQNNSAQTITTTSETAVGLTDLLSAVGAGGEGTAVSGIVNLTPGTAATAAVIRLRVGSGVSGTLIATAQTTTVIAGSAISIPFSFLDTTSSTPENTQYSLTVQMTAATGNTTVNAVSLLMTDVTSAL